MLDEYPSDVEVIMDKEIGAFKKVEHMWKPFPFRFEEKKKSISDFPFLGIRLHAISERALAALKDLIDPYVEILPLNIENSDQVFYALNVLQTYDIDVTRSDYIGEQFISYVEVHAFPNDILPQAPIFRVAHASNGFYFLDKLYVSDDFRELVEANKLRGLLFEEELKYRTGSYIGKRIGIDDENEQENESNSQPPHKTYRIRKTKSSLKFKHYPAKDIGAPITKKMMVEFENNLPRALPDDYREFLKQCNGGTMDEENNAFFIQGIPGLTETNEGDEGIVAWFDSLNPNRENGEEDLLSQYLVIRGEGVFPDYCLPIGSDYGGNLILLSLGERDYGHIYYWEHELGWGEAGSLEPDYSHCYHAANSFTELIDSLHRV